MKLLKNKYVVIILTVVILSLITTSTFKKSITDRGMIVGISIDYVDDETIDMAVQMVVPKGSSDSGVAGNSCSVVKVRGKNVIELLIDLLAKTSAYPSLGHTSTLIVGEEFLLKRDFKPIAETLLKNTKIAEDTILVCAKGRADAVLCTDTTVNSISAFAIEKDIKSTKIVDVVAETSLAEYYISRFNKHPFFAMPYVEASEEVYESDDGSNNGTSKPKKAVSVTSTALIGDRLALVIDKDLTVAYNIVKKDYSKGIITLMPDISFEVLSKNFDMEVETDGEKIYAKAEVEFSLSSLIDNNSVKSENLTFEVTDEQIKTLENKIADDIKSTFCLCKENALDAYNVYAKLHKKLRDDIENYPDYLENTEFEVNVKIRIF